MSMALVGDPQRSQQRWMEQLPFLQFCQNRGSLSSDYAGRETEPLKVPGAILDSEGHFQKSFIELGRGKPSSWQTP